MKTKKELLSLADEASGRAYALLDEMSTPRGRQDEARLLAAYLEADEDVVRPCFFV
jgi:hypothetical protein